MPIIVNQRIKFAPTKVGGCVLWLKADKGITSSSDKVSQWDDQSGLGNHAVQATGANQPSYIENVINGMPVVRFGGSPMYMDVPDNTSLQSQNGTYFVVMKSSTANTFILIANSNFEADRYGFSVWANSGSLNAIIGDSTSFKQLITSKVIADNNPNSVCFLFDSSNLFAFVNTVSQGALSRAGQVVAWNGFNLTIAKNAAANGRYYTGDIAEIIMFDRDLTSIDRLIVEAYLNNKYRMY